MQHVICYQKNLGISAPFIAGVVHDDPHGFAIELPGGAVKRVNRAVCSVTVYPTAARAREELKRLAPLPKRSAS